MIMNGKQSCLLIGVDSRLQSDLRERFPGIICRNSELDRLHLELQRKERKCLIILQFEREDFDVSALLGTLPGSAFEGIDLVVCRNDRQAIQCCREGLPFVLVRTESSAPILSAVARMLNRAARMKQLQSELKQLTREKRELTCTIQDLEAIGSLARTVSSTLLIEEILHEILHGIQQVLHFDRVLLGLVDSEKGLEEVKLAVGVEKGDLSSWQWPIAAGDTVWQSLRASRAPLVIEAERHSNLPGFVGRSFQGSFIKAPLVVKDQILGTVMAGRRGGSVSNRDQKMLQSFAEFAQIAVENGRLYYEVIRSEEELKNTQKKLLQAGRLAVIGQMAVSVNHEINNPLCNISLINQLVQQELREVDPQLAQRLDGINENVARIQEITHRLSDLKDAKSIEYLPDQLMIKL